MQKNAKERCALFGFISHKKMIESRKKKNVKERSVLYIRLKKNLTFFFAIYMYISIYICIYLYILSIYIYIYLYISIYIIYCIYIYIYISAVYIYIEKNNATFWVLLRSFTFFAKECCVLCILLCSLEKNAKERIILLGLISRQNTQKKNVKERCVL